MSERYEDIVIGGVVRGRRLVVDVPVIDDSESLLAQYTSAMEELFDTTAQSRRYDNRITCALRAGYPGPFQPEGLAFATWMDSCNAMGYTVMGEVLAGTRPLPTVGEFLALLPAMEWPQ